MKLLTPEIKSVSVILDKLESVHWLFNSDSQRLLLPVNNNCTRIRYLVLIYFNEHLLGLVFCRVPWHQLWKGSD